MGARLRVVLDQSAQVVDPDTAAAAASLTLGLIATAPRGCDVEAVVPAGGEVRMPGLAEVRTLGLARRELLASWQLGIAPGVGGGLLHAPSLMAPLVKHDRVNDDEQVTVTVWDLSPWEAPERLPKASVAWQRAMLRRAAKHADAVVVPSHDMADRIGRHAKLGDRVRVIAGAAPEGFSAPSDEHRRRADLMLPEDYVVLVGHETRLGAAFGAVAATGMHAVVIDGAEGSDQRIADRASAAGLPERRVHVRGRLEQGDRAAVLHGARAVLGADDVAAWPWRVLEAMAMSVPVVAVDSGTHRDVVGEGGRLVAEADLADALADAVGEGAARLRVLAGDRARAFSWASAAERVWALHADL